MKKKFENLFKKEGIFSKYSKIIGSIFLIALFIGLLFAGFCLLGALLWVVILTLAIILNVFKAISSFIVAFLFKYLLVELKTILGFWTESKSLFNTLNFLNDFSLIHLMLFFHSYFFLRSFFIFKSLMKKKGVII